MKKPTLRPEAYFLYLVSLVLGIFAIGTFPNRDFSSIWYYAVILAVVLFLYPTCLYIKDVRLWRVDPDKYVKQVEERKRKQRAQEQKLREMKNAEEARKKQMHEEKHLPNCPNCGSWNTVRISTASRAASIATVGAASGKIGKQYQCKDCRHMW